MATPVTPEKRTLIISAIKDGMSIPDAAQTHSVTVGTIRKWMRRGTNNSHTSSTELQKAKKRIEFLESIILDLVLEQKAATRKGVAS